MSKEDPKHGRWILPLVIAGLVGLTYSFVNALPPAEVPLGSTTIATSATTLPSTTTTTTLPQDIQDFLALVDEYETTAAAIETSINETNDAWERKDITSSETHDQFSDQLVEAQTLSDSVGATNPPDAYAEAWVGAVEAAAALPPGVEAIIAGLEAPDDGSQRREAVRAYTDLTAAFINALNAVRGVTP